MGFRSRLLTVTLLSLATALLMQNCKPVLELRDINLDPQDKKSIFGSGFGGEGYEGKIYLALAIDACPDESKVDARLEITADGAQYLRRDCQDLTTPLAIAGAPADTGASFEFDARRFELEYVRSEGVGVSTPGLALGSYAPALREYDLGVTWGLQAAPLGANHVLVAQAFMPHQIPGSRGETAGRLILYERRGFNLVELERRTLPVPFMEPDYVDPFANLAPLGDSRALLFAERYKESGRGYQTLLIERAGAALKSVTEGPWFPATGRGVSGSPLDDRRLLVAYRNDTTIEYRVIEATAEGPVVMGEALGQPAEALTPAGPEAIDAPAFLATADPSVFHVYKENAGLGGDGALGVFELRAEGRTLSARAYTTLPGLGAQALYPVAVGSSARGVVLAQSADAGLVWASVLNGAHQVRGRVSYGDLTGEPVGLGSMAGSRSLFLNDLAFLRLPDMFGDGVWMMDPAQGRLRRMNLYFKHSFSMGTGRFFSSGPYLVYTHQDGNVARVGLVSVPEALDE